VGDGLVRAREGEVLAAGSRDSGEVVVGDTSRASRGACPAGSWRGGGAQRGAWGSKGGLPRRLCTWPELVVACMPCDASDMLGRFVRAKSGECRRPPRQATVLGGVEGCCGARGHGGQGEEEGEERGVCQVWHGQHGHGHDEFGPPLLGLLCMGRVRGDQ
jgi:hypothetical protein